MSPGGRTYQTEAIVLKAMRLGEADRLLTMLTPSLGKVRAVARGALKPKSKLAGHVEPFTRAALMVRYGHTLDVVAQAQAQESYQGIRSDLAKTSLAFYMVELADRFAAEGQESYPLYSLLVEALTWLEQTADVGLARPAFELQVLRLSGYALQLSRCQKCREETAGDAWLSLDAGGVLCSRCRGQDPGTRPLSAGARAAMRYLQNDAFLRGVKVKLSAGMVREIEAVAEGYTTHVLEQALKSTAFMEQVRRDGPLPASGGRREG